MILEIGLCLIALCAVAGVPYAVVLVIKENRKTFDAFTAHLQTGAVLVGGEPSEIAMRRLEIEEQKVALEADRIAANAEAHREEVQLKKGMARLRAIDQARVES